MVRFRRVLAVVPAVLALAMGACGGDDGNDGGGGSPAATVDISATEFKFDPADPALDKTGVVRFNVTNDGKFPHALEVEGPSGEKQTEQIEPGKSASLEIDLGKAGTYEMYCPVDGHKAKGMTGEVKVAGGGSGGGSSKKSSGGY